MMQAANNGTILRATFARRAAAGLIDTAIVVIAGLMLGTLFFMYVTGPMFAAHGTEAGLSGGIAAGKSIGDKAVGGLMLGILGGIFGSLLAGFISILAGLLTAGTIAAIAEAFTGRSVGKLLLGMRTALADGTDANLRHCLLRAFCKYAYAVLCVTGLLTGTASVFAAGLLLGIVSCVGCFLVLGHEHLALHDHICGTAIVRKASALHKGEA